MCVRVCVPSNGGNRPTIFPGMGSYCGISLLRPNLFICIVNDAKTFGWFPIQHKFAYITCVLLLSASQADIHFVRLPNVRCGGSGGGGGSQCFPNTLVNENVMLAMKYARLN